MPLTIKEAEGRYHLSSLRGASLRLPRIDLLSINNSRANLLESLRSVMGDGCSFSAREAAATIHVNRWTMIALLKEAHEAGKLNREGKGPATKYSFPTSARLAG